MNASSFNLSPSSLNYLSIHLQLPDFFNSVKTSRLLYKNWYLSQFFEAKPYSASLFTDFSKKWCNGLWIYTKSFEMWLEMCYAIREYIPLADSNRPPAIAVPYASKAPIRPKLPICEETLTISELQTAAPPRTNVMFR